MGGEELRGSVEQELQRVLADPGFERSPALSRLLRFLAEEQLAGRGDELKETVIGHVLYRREASYDTKLDSVVRVNANRLRVRLEQYYAQHPEGKLRIVLRKGTYVPAFLESPRGRTEGEIRGELAAPAELRVATAGRGGAPAGLRLTWWVAAGVLCVLALVGWMRLRRPVPGQPREYWSARTLSHLGGSQTFPELSPNGQTLAFVWAPQPASSAHVYLQSLAAETPVRLSAGSAEESRPWSPDGARIAFLRFNSGNKNKDVVVRELAGGRERVVSSLSGSDPWLAERRG